MTQVGGQAQALVTLALALVLEVVLALVPVETWVLHALVAALAGQAAVVDTRENNHEY